MEQSYNPVNFSMDSAGSQIEFVLNGQSIAASGFSPQLTLLDFLRERGLTGSKEGCAEGECGACAVLSVEPGARGSQYRAVNSCLLPLVAAADREIVTVEGLARNGELCEVQRALVEHGGSQCGYCTPGFVVSMFAEHSRGDCGPRDPHVLGGNLCRCTGYRPIADAFQSLPALSKSPLIERLGRDAQPLRSVDYARGKQRFSRPTSLSELLAALDDGARLIAGNTDLGVLSNLRDQVFGHLVSVEAVPELREFHDADDLVEIGAALTLTEIAERWLTAPTAVRQWLPLFASPLIRNRATLGGNLGTASPIGDAAPLFLALDASLRTVSTAGERSIPLSSFFTAYRQTVLRSGEIIRSIQVPKPFADRTIFYKVAKRKLDDISTVAAAFAIHQDGKGLVTKARLAFGGVGPTPVRALAAESALQGQALGHPDIELVRQSLATAVTPIDDHRGSAAYRRQVAQNLAEKFLRQDLQREL